MPDDVVVKPISGDELDKLQNNNVTIQNGKPSDQIDIKPEDNPESDEYKQKMAAKADKGLNIDGSQDADNLLAGKFKTAEDLEKGFMSALKTKYEGDAYKEMGNLLTKHGGNMEDAYKELAGDLSKPTDAGDSAGDSDNTDTGASDKDGDDLDDKTLNQDGSDSEDVELDISSFVEEFSNAGELSDQSYQELEKAGYGRDQVDTFMDGVRFRIQEIQNLVGGPKNYESMVTWAGEKLPEAEVQKFNEEMNSGNKTRQNDAVKLLAAKYEQAVGFKPGQRIEGNQPNTSVGGYQSMAEWKRDMADERYAKDEAFRKQVAEKLRRTTAF